MTDYRAALTIALDAVRMASDLVRSQPLGEVISKGDRDAASNVDYAVERLVREYLHEHTPDIGFLGEEGGGDSPKAGTMLWALDPIDGTMNFLRGLPLCAVSLGLLDGTQPAVGVIDLPFLGATYHAAQGTGAWKGDKKLRVSTTDRLADAVVAMGDYAVGEGSEEKNKLRLAIHARLAAKVQRVRMLGSATIDLAWVAEGRLDASIMLSNKPWETAAGSLIVGEAGAHVADRKGDKHTAECRSIIVTNGRLKTDILALTVRDNCNFY